MASRDDTARLPPGPRLPMPLQTAAMVRDPVGFLARCERRYGPVFRVRLLGFPRYVYVADPQLAREVYAADRAGALGGEARRQFLEPAVGRHSLLCAEGDEWLRQRKLLAPPFHRRRIEGFDAEIAAIAREQIDRWPSTGESLALRPRMQAITLEVILRLVFGISDQARLGRLRELLPALIDAGASPLLWVLPEWVRDRLPSSTALRRRPSPLRRFLALRDEVDEILYDEIRRRRAGARRDGQDVLSQLLESRNDDGRPMSDLELRDELVTLLEAGHETTATALAWTFERLVRAPDAIERLTSELREGREEFLDAVVKESLRSRTVILDTPRILTRPLELAGYEIPEGWWVAPALPLVQHSARVYSDPEEFRPERFLDGEGGREGWIPFGGGKRHCVGSHLALLELKVITREVLRRFELAPVDANPERARVVHVTLVPSELARVRVRPRERARTAP
jgi:cytochrome P450 family 135